MQHGGGKVRHRSESRLIETQEREGEIVFAVLQTRRSDDY
jgi:hypothetical protein